MALTQRTLYAKDRLAPGNETGSVFLVAHLFQSQRSVYLDSRPVLTLHPCVLVLDVGICLHIVTGMWLSIVSQLIWTAVSHL